MDFRSPSFRRALEELLLRSVPLLPANEIMAVIQASLKKQDDVDKQIQEAVDALSRSSQLIDSLGDTLKEREKKLKELKSEYDRVSQLASLTSAQGEAIAASLARVIGRGQTKERWIAFAINIIAGLLLFVLGVFASDWVKSIPNKFVNDTSKQEQKATEKP